MKVKECMTKNVICVGEYESADVAARLMARYNLGSLPVRRFDGSLSGMVTDRDVVLRCVAARRDAEHMRVGEMMSTGILAVEASGDISRAAQMMSRAQLRRLPVTQNGHLTGMLSLADLARRGNFSMETAQCMESSCSQVVHLDSPGGKAAKILDFLQ